MGIATVLLIGLAAVAAWFLLAGAMALLAGRVIHERDVHDRPVERVMRRPRPVLSRH